MHAPACSLGPFSPGGEPHISLLVTWGSGVVCCPYPLPGNCKPFTPIFTLCFNTNAGVTYLDVAAAALQCGRGKKVLSGCVQGVVL